MSAIKQKRSIVGLKDLRVNMDAYILRLKKGESFTVVRRSHPVFTLSPADADEESAWETIVDFTDIDERGVSAREVLRALKKLHA